MESDETAASHLHDNHSEHEPDVANNINTGEETAGGLSVGKCACGDESKNTGAVKKTLNDAVNGDIDSKTKKKKKKRKEKYEGMTKEERSEYRERKRKKKREKEAQKLAKSANDNSSDKLPSRVRPEPEGGVFSPATEFEKLIYNSEPLFSDIEDVPDEPERPQRQRKNRGFVPCIQLGVNSNTIIKFTIIGTEIQNIYSILRRAEGEVAGLTRKVRLLEDDLEQTETRLNTATEKLEEASKAADESERISKVLSNKGLEDEARISQLERDLDSFTTIAEDADRKYDEAARKLAITEVDLERAEARLESSESKIVELEEELKVVGNNMKSLEISEQEASQREDSYEETIRDLTARLKDAETRATEAERTVSKLQKEVDRLEDELLAEKERYRAISDELDATFAEFVGN